jgi:hypothetical protein
MVADAASLHDHLVSNGTRIIKGLHDADYGLRGFVFATQTATASTSASSCRPGHKRAKKPGGPRPPHQTLATCHLIAIDAAYAARDRVPGIPPRGGK